MTLRALPGVLAAVLAAMLLYTCPGDPGHENTYECSKRGKPSHRTPQGQRCYDK
jgi:hypothetical protein